MFKKCLLTLLFLGLFESQLSYASFKEAERQQALKIMYRGVVKIVGGSAMAVGSYWLKMNALDPQDRDCLYPSNRGERPGDIRMINSGIDLLIRPDDHCYDLTKRRIEGTNQGPTNFYDFAIVGGGLIVCNGVTDIFKGFFKLCFSSPVKPKQP